MTAPGAIRIPVVPDMTTFGGLLKSGLGGALAVAGVGVGFAEVIKIGNDFTNTLNTLQAVSSATADQMAAVSARAKELGNDMTIPNTSASNAAEAMTELAKGGFSVEQSMAAAKGTLQLAAAAQIDAATAAGIQSKALQTFGLDAEYAATAADVLANAANASNLEISDVALGLQAGGTVANQFGLTLEETSAALGVFANVGIRGSDAGTLLKSALLALTDQGNPAQAAIEQLGLSVYDAGGQFVGLSSLMHQLEDASKTMSPEMYQAATATLFGSDAMRLAGVAAEGGAQKFDVMVNAVNRQGTAAEVATAKTLGLPGALQQLQNKAEDAALQLYELIDGPLAKLATAAAGGIAAATTNISEAISSVGDSSGGGIPALSGFADSLDGLREIGVNALDILRPLGEGVVNVTGSLSQSGGIVSTVGQAWSGFVNVISGALAVLEPVADAIGATASFFAELPGPVQTATIALVAFRILVPILNAQLTTMSATLGVALFGAATRASMAMGRLSASMAAASISASLMGGSAGLAVARTALSSLASLAGGPLVLGLVAATFAFSAISSGADRVADSAKTARQYTEDLAKSQVALRDALTNSNGVVDDGVLKSVTAQVDLLRTSSEKLAADAPGIFGYIGAGFSQIGDVFDGQIESTAGKAAFAAEEVSNAAEKISDQFERTGKTSDELGKIIAGTDAEVQAFIDTLNKRGDFELAGKVRDMHTEFVRSKDSATKAADAIEKINDHAVGASVGIDGLVNSMKQLRDDERSVEEAQKSLTLALDGFRSSVQSGGDAALFASGQINLASVEGVNLDNAMKRVADAWVEAGGAARTAAVEQKLSSAEVEAAVVTAQNRVRDEFFRSRGELNLTDQQAQALIDTFLRMPEKIAPKVELDYGSEVAKFQEFKQQLEGTPIFFQSILNPAPLPPGLFPALPGNASGGRLPTTGPGTDVTDGFLGLIGGMPAVRLDGGEQITRASMAERYGAELEAINAGTFPKLPGYAEGGRIAVDRAFSYLRGEDNKEYQYGGVGSPSWDCSGFISAAYALVTALEPTARWFTTESNFETLGFLSGLDPTGRGLSIGVHNGGGGMYSHMAGTLAGVNLESGSNGVQVGDGAAGAGDSQFENRYYLPASAFVPADLGKENGISAGDPTGTGSATTEPTSSTSTPSISAATTSGTQVQSLQDVLNNIPEGLGNVAKSAITGQLSDAFGALGINQSSNSLISGIGAGIDYGLQLQKEREQKPPPVFSDTEIQRQGPVTPGTPGWYEELMKTFRIPAIDAVLRDQGGPLQHGMAALNLSGETEWVSTAAQRAQELALMRNGSSGGGGTTTIDARTVVEAGGIQTGISEAQFQRSWKNMQAGSKQRALSYMPRRR